MIPGLERSPGEGKGYPLQYSGLENSMDCSPWGRKELDTTERLSLSTFRVQAQTRPILEEETEASGGRKLRPAQLAGAEIYIQAFLREGVGSVQLLFFFFFF